MVVVDFLSLVQVGNMKTSSLLLAATVGSASAFAPAPFTRSTALCMSDDTPQTTAIVPINEETVEFTAGILGGVVGFSLGGPVLGAIGAAAANYASKTDAEVSEVLTAVSKTSIQIFNYFSKLDSKYEVLDKAKSQLETALDKVKANDNANPETIQKIESALSSATSKIEEIDDEYDLVGSGMTALGVVGDLVEKAIIKAGEINEEYQLSDKAIVALGDAVDKAKSASSKAASSMN